MYICVHTFFLSIYLVTLLMERLYQFLFLPVYKLSPLLTSLQKLVVINLKIFCDSGRGAIAHLFAFFGYY